MPRWSSVSSRTWSNIGLIALAILTLVLIAANVIQNRDREAAVLASLSSTATSATATTQAAPPVALFFGDSYFNGAAGVSADQTEANVAAAQLGYVPHVAGYGGTGFVADRKGDQPAPNYVAQLDAGALETVDRSGVRLVVVEGGLNDLGKPDDQVTRNAGTVLAKMAQTFPDAKVVLLGPVATTGTATPPQNDVVAALTAAAKTANVPFIDATGWITPGSVASIIGPDEVHPTVDGHKALGGQLAKALRDLGLAVQ